MLIIATITDVDQECGILGIIQEVEEDTERWRSGIPTTVTKLTLRQLHAQFEWQEFHL